MAPFYCRAARDRAERRAKRWIRNRGVKTGERPPAHIFVKAPVFFAPQRVR